MSGVALIVDRGGVASVVWRGPRNPFHVAPVELQPQVRIGRPQILFDSISRNWRDISSDDRRLLVVRDMSHLRTSCDQSPARRAAAADGPRREHSPRASPVPSQRLASKRPRDDAVARRKAKRSLNGAPFAATVDEKNMARTKDAQPLDAAAARAWMARWQEVGRATLAEAQALTAEEKLDQLESLMLSADLFDWPEAMEL